MPELIEEAERRIRAMRQEASGLKLRIQLIPKPTWGRNLRKALTARGWERISHPVRARAGGCEICGGSNRLQCDEQWAYDDERHVQRLIGLRCVCQTCHNVMNWGRSSIVAVQEAERYPTLLEDLKAHFMRVNGVDASFFDRYLKAASVEHSLRSRHEWVVEYGDYSAIVGQVEAMRADRRTKKKPADSGQRIRGSAAPP
jgi:hypothetical protein